MKEKKPMKKWVKILLGIVGAWIGLWILAFIIMMFVPSDDTATNSTTTAVQTTAAITSQTTQKIETTASTTVSQTTTEPTTQKQTTTKPTTTKEKLPNNPLLLETVRTAPVMNGAGTEKIGEYAFIKIPKDVFDKEVSKKQLYEFAQKEIKDKSYNWFSIIFDDGTGIVANGCFTGQLTYGTIANDGTINNVKGYYTSENGTYTYEKA